MLGLYSPAKQPRQEPVVPVQPAPHTQTLAEAFESSRAPQSVHGADPGAGLYFPATQPVHLPSVPDQAALQRQKVMLSLPATDIEFSAHGRHFDLSFAE